MLQDRTRFLIGLSIFAIIYLIGHYLVFDREFQFTTIAGFLAESKEHAWHILPVFLILGFFIKDAYDRIKKKGAYAPATVVSDPNNLNDAR